MTDSTVIPDPTVQTVLLRFTEFSDTDPALIGLALEEAKLFVGSWPHSSKTLALLYMTAHILTVNNIVAESGGRELRHESIGRFSQTFAEANNSGSPDKGVADLTSTAYGRRYSRLQSKLISPFKTVGHRRRGHTATSGSGTI